MKRTIYLLTIALAALSTSAFGQTINIGPNQYAFQYTVDPDFGMFFNSTQGHYELRDGSAVPVWAVNALNGDLETDITFGSSADLLIDADRYAFRYSGAPNYGLFFNATGSQYEFRTLDASPVMTIHANTGDISTPGNIGVGAAANTVDNIYAFRPNGDVGANKAAIHGYRWGNSGDTTGGTSWSTGGVDAAVKGTVNWGSNYSAAVYGSSVLDYNKSAAVVGSNSSGSVFGALGYRMDNETWAGFFNGNVNAKGKTYMDGSHNMTTTTDGALTIGDRDGLRISLDNNQIDAFTNTGPNATLYLNFYGGEVRVGNTTTGRLRIGTSAGSQLTIGSTELIKDAGTNLLQTNAGFDPVPGSVADMGWFTCWDDIVAYNFINCLISPTEKVHEIDYGIDDIMELNPVKYQVDQEGFKIDRLGLEADALKSVISEAVKSEDVRQVDENGEYVIVESENKGIDYIALIPVLIAGMQDQQEMIEEQNAKIAALEAALNSKAIDKVESAPAKSVPTNVNDNSAWMSQNVPNPFSSTSKIDYFIPENVKTAYINVISLDGKIVGKYKLDQGHGEIMIGEETLSNGMYIYDMIIDGVVVESKRMVIQSR